VAKRKLVSAALLLISLQGTLQRKQKLQQALGKWRAFEHSSSIAEGAFNKILEINHKHSKVRFETAAKIL